MSEIVLFHSVLGVRPSVHTAADLLRAGGHTVHVPDLYDGRVFDDCPEAFEFLEGIGGYPELMKRTAEAVAGLGTDLVYAGFSNGSACASYLAITRPGARAAVLMHGTVPVRMFGPDLTWPAGVPVQAHEGRDDPYRSEEDVQGFAADVQAAGTGYTYFQYPVAGHLFADAGLPAEYDAAAADLMWQRVLGFLTEVDMH